MLIDYNMAYHADFAGAFRILGDIAREHGEFEKAFHNYEKAIDYLPALLEDLKETMEFCKTKYC